MKRIVSLDAPAEDILSRDLSDKFCYALGMSLRRILGLDQASTTLEDEYESEEEADDVTDCDA